MMPSNRPYPINLNFENIDTQLDGNACDDIISGWVQYWNDIFRPEIPLSPNKEKYICLSGPYEPLKGYSQKIWSFEKFKTRKGCASYFAGECDRHCNRNKRYILRLDS